MQALGLLAEIREYARDWLRHEAEQLIRHYGRVIDGVGPQGDLGGDPGPGRGLGIPGGTGPVAAVDRALARRGLGSAMRRHVGRFFDRARNFIRESILAGAMALSGPEGLDDEDLAEADRQHAEQVKFLDQFHRDMEMRTPPELADPSGLALENPMTAKEFVARAEMYGGVPWGAAQTIERKGVIRLRGAVRERRSHWREVDHPCQTCAAESAKGWVPVGTLLPIGDSECLGISCDCYFSYELPDGSVYITGRGWRRAA